MSQERKTIVKRAFLGVCPRWDVHLDIARKFHSKITVAVPVGMGGGLWYTSHCFHDPARVVKLADTHA